MARWTANDIPPQAGRLAVVTGTGGLGYETALALSEHGAAVILAGRNEQKGREAIRKIRTLAPGAGVRFELLDLADLASIAAFAKRLLDQDRPLDLLVNNAGVMSPPSRRATADGFELQFGTNYLGHFALTSQLLPLLVRGSAPRVVAVSSGAHRLGGAIHFDDLQWERTYKPWAAYAQSKLAHADVRARTAAAKRPAGMGPDEQRGASGIRTHRADCQWAGRRRVGNEDQQPSRAAVPEPIRGRRRPSPAVCGHLSGGDRRRILWTRRTVSS